MYGERLTGRPSHSCNSDSTWSVEVTGDCLESASIHSLGGPFDRFKATYPLIVLLDKEPSENREIVQFLRCVVDVRSTRVLPLD